MPFIRPFISFYHLDSHPQDGWKTISCHLVISSLVCILPVCILVHMGLSNPGQAAYFFIWGR